MNRTMKGASESWEEWGRRIVAEGARRTAERSAASALEKTRDIEKRARYHAGWNLLEREADELVAQMGPAESQAQLEYVDAHVLVADLRDHGRVKWRRICSLEDPSLRAACIPPRDGRILGAVLVPGDWQVRALRARVTIAAPELPAEALS